MQQLTEKVKQQLKLQLNSYGMHSMNWIAFDFLW